MGAWFAAGAAAALHVGQPGSPWTGVLPMLLGAVGTVTYSTPAAVVLLGLMEPLFGTSPGKILFRLYIVNPHPDAPWRPWIRFACKTSGAGILCAAFALQSGPLAGAGVVVSLLALAGGSAALAGAGAWYDRVAGTGVTPVPRRERSRA